MGRIRVGAAAVLLGAALGGAEAGGATGPVIEARGLLRAEAELSLCSREAGVVKSLPKIEGETVQPGEAVVVLDDVLQQIGLTIARNELEAAQLELRKTKDVPRAEDLEKTRALLKEAEAAEAFAERSYRSDQDLYSKSVVSDLNLQRSERALEQAKLVVKSRGIDLAILEKGPRPEDVRLAEIKVEHEKAAVSQAEQALERTRIAGVRPGRAYVGRVWVDLGQWVDPGKPVANLVYMDRLRVELDLPVEDGFRVARGAKASVRSARFPDVTLEGKVESVAPVVDASSGTVRVVVTVDNPGIRMRPGVEAAVEIVP